MKDITSFQNLRDCLNFLDFGVTFLGIFLEEFLGKNFLTGFFCGGFFWRNSLGIDLFVKILVFVKILYLRKGR